MKAATPYAELEGCEVVESATAPREKKKKERDISKEKVKTKKKKLGEEEEVMCNSAGVPSLSFCAVPILVSILFL